MLYLVEYVTSIIAGRDHVYVLANNEEEAKKLGEPMLNKNKIHPSYLNDGYILCIPL